MIHSTFSNLCGKAILAATIFCNLSLISANKNDAYNHLLPNLSDVDKVVEDEMIKQEIYGCAVGVVKDGQIVHVKAYGYNDRMRTKPIDQNAIFRWASISKTITAVAAFKAIEAGKMNLDDKVSKYVNYWPTSGAKGDITIRHLLNNRSGINHYGSYNRSAYLSFKNFNARECVAVFSSASLISIPGAENNYTTFGYNLLGAAVEEATGVPYETYVKNNIGIVGNIPSLTPYPAEPGGYEKDCNGFLSGAKEGNVEWKLPGGGWGSTIEGLTKFMQGLVMNSYLSNTAALWQPVADNKSYCFGTKSNGRLGAQLKVYHGGAHDGLRTYMVFYPALKLGVVYMMNGGAYLDESYTRLSERIFSLFGAVNNVSVLPRNECGKNLKCGDKAIGVWRKTNNVENTIIRRGYTSDQFNAEWKWLGEHGYYCADFNTYERSSNRKWDGIFKKSGNESAMIRNYTYTDFNKKWMELSNQGYRLVDVETYLDAIKPIGSGTTLRVRKWAGLFIKMSGGYFLHLEMSQQELHDKWIEYGKMGMKLVDIEKYGDKWAGVWIKGDNVAMVRNYQTLAFRDKRRELNEKGWRLIDVDTYMDGSTRKWSGLWEKSNIPEHYLYGFDYCDWLKTYHNDYSNDGYELIDMEVY